MLKNDKIEKIKVEHTKTEDGIQGKTDYIIAPTVKEMVNKINELVDAYNKIQK